MVHLRFLPSPVKGYKCPREGRGERHPALRTEAGFAKKILILNSPDNCFIHCFERLGDVKRRAAGGWEAEPGFHTAVGAIAWHGVGGEGRTVAAQGYSYKYNLDTQTCIHTHACDHEYTVQDTAAGYNNWQALKCLHTHTHTHRLQAHVRPICPNQLLTGMFWLVRVCVRVCYMMEGVKWVNYYGSVQRAPLCKLTSSLS